MRKILFLLLMSVILIGSTFNLSAQEKKNQIKTSLVMPLARVFQLSYERVLNNEMSIELAAGAGEDLTFINPQFRYYLNEDKIAPSGTFISPYILIAEYMTGGGLTVGYQRLFKQKVSLEAFVGPLISEDITIWGGVNIGLAF